MLRKTIPLMLATMLPVAFALQAQAQPPGVPPVFSDDRSEDLAWRGDRERIPGNDNWDRRRGPDNRYPSGRIVQHRPQAPRYRVPRQPSPYHVWVAEEWMWQQGRYFFSPGSWVVPPRRGLIYVPGYWERVRGGWVWTNGYWAGGQGNWRRW